MVAGREKLSYSTATDFARLRGWSISNGKCVQSNEKLYTFPFGVNLSSDPVRGYDCNSPLRKNYSLN